MVSSLRIVLFTSFLSIVATIVLFDICTNEIKSSITSNVLKTAEMHWTQQDKTTNKSSMNTNSFDCDGDTWKSWIPPVVPYHIQDAEQDNPALIDHIKNNWLIPPCSGTQRSLTSPQKTDFSQNGQGSFIDKYLNKTHGFYIECGGFDGETFSNTLGLEIYSHWDGLLIEADPTHFKNLLSKHRRAFKINSCLSPNNLASKFDFMTDVQITGLADQRKSLNTFLSRIGDTKKEEAIQAQCFPFYSIYSALESRVAAGGKLHVDLFSLDIEGAETDIIRTIPFEKVDISLFLIEYHIPAERELSKQKWNWIKQFLGSKGYRIVDGCPAGTDILMEKIQEPE